MGSVVMGEQLPPSPPNGRCSGSVSVLSHRNVRPVCPNLIFQEKLRSWIFNEITRFQSVDTQLKNILKKSLGWAIELQAKHNRPATSCDSHQDLAMSGLRQPAFRACRSRGYF